MGSDDKNLAKREARAYRMEEGSKRRKEKEEKERISREVILQNSSESLFFNIQRILHILICRGCKNSEF